jgi:DNA (cytosine-5)-methyltransferase 1
MRFFSMFSGIGGFDLAFQRHGHECAGYSEIDKYAIKVYENHFLGVRNYGDATKINGGKLPEFEMLCGGFPCQAFSIAGKRGGFEDTRGTLFFEIARLCKERRPKLLLLENVKGLLSHDGGRTFGTILNTLGELGYWWEYQVLNSKDFGVPQNRERVFIVGHLAGERSRAVFPLGEDDETADGGGGEEGTPPEDICGAITATEYKQHGDGSYILQRNQHGEVVRKGISGAVHTAMGNNQSPKVVQLNNPNHSNNRVYGSDGVSPSLNTMQGGNRQPKIAIPDNNSRGFSVAEPFDGIRLQFPQSETARGRVVKQNSQALQASGAGGVLLPDTRIRRLTEVECERLQGFPDGWTEGISSTQRYKCLGNAVTVNVVEEIVKRL